MQKTIKQIIQHVKRNGIEGLLPQNLPNNILDMLLSESDLDTTYSFDNGSIEVLIFVVLSLKCKKRTKRATHRVFIRLPMSLDIRPVMTELIRPLCA